MRVLCLFPIFRSGTAKLMLSGAERQFIEICKRWCQLGNEIQVVATDYAKRLCENFGLEVSTLTFEPVKIKLVGFEDLINVQKLCKIINCDKFDFIYCPNESFEYILTSALAKNKCRIPLVAIINQILPEDLYFLGLLKSALSYTQYRRGLTYFQLVPRRLFFVFKKKIRNILIQKIDLIFAVSGYHKKILLRMGIDAHRIYSIPSGIDYHHIRSYERGREYKKFDASFLGAIIPRKGVLDLIKAWSIVVQAKKDAKLVLIGSGQGYYFNEVKKFILKHNLTKNILMKGFVSEEMKYRLLKQSKIFVFPSYLEGFAQAVCEAMACGLPVIAYRLPVFREFYDDNIVYVDVGDVKGLASKILELLKDKPLQKRMRQAGYKIAERYDWNNIAKQQLEIIKRNLQL